ncbi:MAG: ABC transporter ATP-binding protein [Spirochaetes bacterium]|nr:ABC transporter ATP-binding protein [Spirochaetota bacterium]
MIKIDILSYKKNNIEILKNINAVFNKSEIIGIIGKSGSGKTSLLKAIAGIFKDYEGDILLNNNSVKLLSNKNKRNHIAFSFSNNSYDIIDDTVSDYLMQSRKLFKKFLSPFTDFDHQITEDYLKLFKLNEYRDKKVLTLSDGIFKKVILAFPFIKNAEVLLLDNPTGNLDLESISLVQKAVLKYSINGDKLVIIASNDLNFLLQTADRIVIMEKGTIDSEINPEMIDAQKIYKHFNTEVLISRNIYNGKPDIHQYLKGIG